MGRRSEAGPFQIGQPVTCTGDGVRGVGKVVGVAHAPTCVFYEVELWDHVRKGVRAEELRPATASDIRDELESLASVAVAGGAGPREGFLRARHAHALERLLAGADAPDGQTTRMEARFVLDQEVVCAGEDVWRLGRVVAVRARADSVRYELDVAGSQEVADQEALYELGKPPVAGVAFWLGQRARLVVAGHEQDDDYLGTICTVSRSAGTWSYDLMFDDGDVFEGLEASDLA